MRLGTPDALAMVHQLAHHSLAKPPAREHFRSSLETKADYPSFFLFFLLSATALIILSHRIVPHSPAPASRRPCRRALPEWRCASSRSLALRRANVFR